MKKNIISLILLGLFFAALGFVYKNLDIFNDLSFGLGGDRNLAQVGFAPNVQINRPELPRNYIDTTLPVFNGETIVVPTTIDPAANGDALKAAIVKAQPGDKIVLTAGAIYQGNFVLPVKVNPNNKYILITSSRMNELPPQGRRVTPADSAKMPLLRTPNGGPVIETLQRTSYYWIQGVEMDERVNFTITTNSGHGSWPVGTVIRVHNGLVLLGTEQTSLDQVPHHLVIDRSYIHGADRTHLKRCVTFNSAWSAVVDSYIAKCVGIGQDTQAIGGWNGPGPFKIVNNYLEAGGENIMFGGADPSIPNLIPTDIEIRGNYIYKDPAWKGYWLVKNIFETKNNQRLIFEGNVLENSWADGQIGFGIVLKSSNDEGKCPWCISQDMVLRYNIIRNTDHGISIHRGDDYAKGGVTPMRRILIENNLFENAGTRMVQISGGPNPMHDIQFVHNTMWSKVVNNGDTPRVLTLGDEPFLINRVNISSNIFISAMGEGYDAIGSGLGAGLPSVEAMFQNWNIQGNAFVTHKVKPIPNNTYTTLNASGFVNTTNNFALSASSPLKGTAYNGKDPGADINLIKQMTNGAVSGVWSPALPPPPTFLPGSNQTSAPVINLAPNPPPPTPVQTPAPALTFSASPTSVSGTQATTLSWSATNVSSCTASGGWSGSKASSGTFTTTLTQSTTYTLTCSGSGGSSSKNVTVSYTAPTPTQTQPITTQSPFKGIFVLPTTIQAEDFDNGGEGISYHDNVPGNAGGKYRTNESVDIIDSTDSSGGGHTVYNLEKGEWLEYSISVPQSGNYTIETRTSNNGYSPKYHIEIDGTSVASFTLPNTLSWNTFQNTAKSGIALSAGNRTLRLVVDEQYANLNWIKITRDGSQPTTPTPATPTPTTPTPPSDDCNPRQTYAKSPTTGEVRIFPAPCDVLVGWIVIPNPNQTAPTLTFNANPTVIGSNQASILTWSSTNASSCTASGDWSGSRAPSGTVTAAPTKTTTYTLSCTGVGGSVSKSVTVSYGGQGPVVPLPTTQTPSGNQTFTASLYYSLKNSEVVALQQFLRTKGLFSEEATGYFGLLTLEAVQAYQVSKGIETTGTVGPQTRAAMNAEISGGVVPKPAVNQPPTNATLSLPRNLSRGSQGIDVIALQTALKQLGYFSDEATGYYGVVTERAVQSFQRAQGIVSGGTANSTGYGVAGPRTRGVLVNAVGR